MPSSLYHFDENDNHIQPVDVIPSWSQLIGHCEHCGEEVWQHDDPGECIHGACHGQCILDHCEMA